MYTMVYHSFILAVYACSGLIFLYISCLLIEWKGVCISSHSEENTDRNVFR